MEQLRKLTDSVLHDSIEDATKSIHSLRSCYIKILGNNLLKDDISLPTGRAISPNAAAECLTDDPIRSILFIRGINAAISKLLVDKECVEILYAGCGPYAALLTPLLSKFKHTQISVTLLDYNQQCLDCCRRLYTALGHELFLAGLVKDDAAKYIIKEHYDIVISETMQAALEAEPQVSIMLNLIPQLPPCCVFIPESVKVELAVGGTGLGTVYEINKSCLEPEEKKYMFPDKMHDLPILLETTVGVYGDYVLNKNDSLITASVFIRVADSRELTIKYNCRNNTPAFTFS